MKYIELAGLSALSDSLTHEGPECAVHTRMEAYSCKNIKRDKKLFKALESSYQEEDDNSSPFASRKILYLLIATLNIAYPDHEFSDVRPSHFIKQQDGASILNALSNTLIAPHRSGSSPHPRSYSAYPPTSPNFFPLPSPSSPSPYSLDNIHSPLAPPPIVSGTHPSLFRIIDDVIGLDESKVFSYTPEIDADPHANDYDDDEDDVASTTDDASSSDDDALFEFDNYDIDEIHPSSPSSSSHITTTTHHSKSISPPPSPRSALNHSQRALLWSSHYFFLNRKKKRILYISVWARSSARMYRHVYPKDHFNAWEGSVGLGARSLGLIPCEPYIFPSSSISTIFLD